MQPRFINKAAAGLLLLGALLLVRRDVPGRGPPRQPRAPAETSVLAMPLPLLNEVGDAEIGALWELRSAERRFGGLSALNWSRGSLTAISDSGAVIRWRPPAGRAYVRDLPGGPGSPWFKINRDAEALAPAGGGDWWVAFEQTPSIYRFDRTFTQVTGRKAIPLRSWWRNWGIEAAIGLKNGRLLLLSEMGDQAFELQDNNLRKRPLSSPDQIADAAALPDGRIIVALRAIRPWGTGNGLGWLEAGREGYRVRPWTRLPLGRWDNIEGLAAEPLPSGRTRLWFVTDNDFRRRTLLGWLEVPPTAPAAARKSE